jgi:hypothetical protein
MLERIATRRFSICGPKMDGPLPLPFPENVSGETKQQVNVFESAQKLNYPYPPSSQMVFTEKRWRNIPCNIIPS